MRKKKRVEKDKVTLIVYLVLRGLVILSMILQGFHGNWNNVFLCILTLILFTLPDLVSNKLEIKFPSTFEIAVYVFIFSAEILGEIQNFYEFFPHWDTILHTLNGFLAAAFGFSLVDILNKKDNDIDMTPAFMAVVAFCFSMTIGVLWEFGEFAVDQYLGKDMQKDRIVNKINSQKIDPKKKNEVIRIDNIDKTIIYSNNNKNVTIIENGYLEIGLIDTIKDLFVNFIGAVIFCGVGYLYIRNGFPFAEKFIPKLKSKLE